MAQPVMQHSFHAGEWSPALGARVDLAKYRSAASLLRNFFVDYRGGASTRMGTRYILQAYKSSTPVRLIPFQASFTVNYALEFGDGYIRFHFNGAPVLEAAKTITGITQASPGVITSTAHGFQTGEWVFLTGIVGMTQLNGRYVQVVRIDANTFSTKRILDNSAINTGAYSAYTSGGTAARVYTLPSPFATADLALIKYTQNVNTMVLCHPNYQPQLLSLVSANNWTITTIVFGSTIPAPTGASVTSTLAAGTVHYSYQVTAVDFNGQESAASAAAIIGPLTDQAVVAGSMTVTWNVVPGVQYYNVYKATRRYGAAVPSGSTHGFIGYAFGNNFIDTNIVSDFSLTPPIAQNPFLGAPVTSYTVTASGTYTVVPSVTVAAPPVGQQSTANAVLGVTGTPTIFGTGAPVFNVGDIIAPTSAFPSAAGVRLVVATVDGTNHILTVQPMGFPGSNPGSISGVGNLTPGNPVAFTKIGDNPGFSASFTLTWGVVSVLPISGGTGYLTPPAVTFSAGAATATSTIGSNTGNPSVPAYFQQRLVLAAPPLAPGQMNFSKPAAFFNFDISNPIQPDDAISATLAGLALQSIKSMIPMPSGLITLTDKQAWLINGGGTNSPITPIDAVANPQAYNGAGDLPPIVANFDLLYVQSKGSIVRDLAFNFYTSVYTGTDISVLSSHLFYGFIIVSWAFAEEPFKVIWAVRSDGQCLSLTFLKEQDLIGWSHSDTQGLFKSNCVVTETTASAGSVDAVYFVIQRIINGNTVQFIERMAERIFPNGVADAWCVDAGLQYSGSPATSFSGAEHLAGTVLTGLADGQVISVTPTIDGTFTLAVAASKVTVGLAFTPQLQTLALDLGEPTIQSKRKKVVAVSTRVQDTLGLSAGRSFTTLTPMKDLVRGNIGTMSNALINNLVTTDARTIVDPQYDVFGQYCFQQSNPFPATILGVIPEIVVGDTPK